MRAIVTRVFAVLFAGFVTACHGGGASGTDTALPQGETRSLSPLQAAGTSATRLWFSSCATCGIAMIHNKEVDVDVFTRAGTSLHHFAFGGGTTGAVPAIDRTSPDQRHVYVTILIGQQNFIADLDTRTYGVRYYRIPLSEQQGEMIGLLVRPDGRRLYVPTTVKLYAINTVTRTYAGTVSGQVASSTLSPDGKTLFGATSGKLIAIDTATLQRRIFAPDPGALATAATSSNLYVGTPQGVRIYNLVTHAYVKTIVPSLVERLVVDPALQRLYAWVNGPTSASTSVVNTTTQSTVKILPNVFQGPFLDPVSHLVHSIDVPGNVCAYTPPAYTKSCSFVVNSSVPFDITFTH